MKQVLNIFKMLFSSTPTSSTGPGVGYLSESDRKYCKMASQSPSGTFGPL